MFCVDTFCCTVKVLYEYNRGNDKKAQQYLAVTLMALKETSGRSIYI